MQILANHLKAALLAAAKHGVRHYLKGVLINSRHIVATDGARMHVIPHYGEWRHGDVVIPRESVEMALKGRVATVEVTPSSIGPVAFTPVDGKFPDYTRVMADLRAGISHGFMVANISPEYAVDAAKAIALVTGRSAQYLAFNGTAWVWSAPQLQIVVMPTRPTKTEPSLTSLEAVL